MPSIVPEEAGPIHFVLCDFGSAGRVYVETDPITATAATIVEDMLDGQYDQPLKVIAVDLAANRVEDVSAKVAKAVLDEAQREQDTLPDGTRAFVEAHLGVEV
jgi:Mg/Co/Ni transporter MgtE